MFVYTLMGLELFAHRAKFNSVTGEVDLENGASQTFNFDNFMNSLTTVFIVLTNDGWSAMLYTYYRAVNGAASVLFFLSLVIIGQKILLNLFLAILLENFDESAILQKLKDKMELEENEKAERKKGKKQRTGILLWVH